MKEVASVALDKSMVGISDATVQFKVFLVDLEDEELEPQAASIKADNVTAAPAPKNLETFIVLSPYLSILMIDSHV
ncbi:hypothetical protein FD23_GL000944 [Lactobacillus delbrueckii subsp. delbrueckii DSM 20074 = JCM 1012]|nr:hypothetical protein FD23_GL000944 [Lactobacillus delbrueckii subsp. delbrueckii DSM 20074 = JCM 1012]